MDKTWAIIQNLCFNWFTKYRLGIEFNTPISIGFSDEEYELLTCSEEGIKGMGASSYGYDHNNNDETKGTSLVQPKICSCGARIPFFLKKCNCGSENFKYMSDSRWGIDSLAHFKYEPPNYHLWVLYPQENDYRCKTFFLKRFVIDSSNKHFTEILKIQNTKGSSKNKNFLPFSSDFYASNPIEKSSFKITLDELYGVYVERNEVENIVYTKDILKKMSKILDKDFLIEKDIYLYEEISEKINIMDKKTSHGKSRGETNRRRK